MIYIIYDFTGLKITKKKYQQYFKTLLYTAKVCEAHSDGNKLFKIRPTVTGCDLCIKSEIAQTSQEMSPHSIEGVSVVPDKVEFSRVLTDSGVCDKCIVCTVEDKDPHDLFILYDVKYDHATILFSDFTVNNVVSSFIQTSVMPFESRGSCDRFISFNPEIGWTMNDCFWNEFWLKEFHVERASRDKFDTLIGALRYSIVGLFYDSLGNDEYAVKASNIITETKRVNMAIWPQLENDIHRHFGCIELVGEDEQVVHGHCGYLDPEFSGLRQKTDPQDNLLRKCSPQKDPCVPPKWLTHFYVDGVENDGEIPAKKKLHDLLDYMVDYVGSWTGCDDAYSAQQMKDILPLLVRCKIILEDKGIH